MSEVFFIEAISSVTALIVLSWVSSKTGPCFLKQSPVFLEQNKPGHLSSEMAGVGLLPDATLFIALILMCFACLSGLSLQLHGSIRVS